MAILTTYPYEDGIARFKCEDCGKWERADKGNIVHSRSCESKLQGNQSDSAAAPAAAGFSAGRNLTPAEYRAVKNGAISQVMDDDEIVEAVKFGHVSVSDAMNRDF